MDSKLILTKEQINEFHETGVLVIENVLTKEEVLTARTGLHEQLLKMGIDHEKILNGLAEPEKGVRIKGRPSKIFYSKWKLDVHLNEKVYSVMRQLMEATYFSSKDKDYEHPFRLSNDILPFIDRICWRLPDHIRSDGGLGLHLDRNPYDPYIGLKKFRPIQSFVTLTDQFGSESGGLRVVKGFHHRINDYFKKAESTLNENISSGGEFFRLNSKSHTALAKELQPISAPAGALVCWDNQLPHATCEKLESYDTREVVYTGWLPNVELNRLYWLQQLEHIKLNIPPPAFIGDDPKENVDLDWIGSDLTEFQQKLMGFS